MNSLKLLSNKYQYKKHISRGGGPIPHNDPPEFKTLKGHRYIPYGQHLMWVFSGAQKEYYLDIKHLHLRGISGSIMNIIRIFLVGTVVPYLFFVGLKSLSHDSRNYYIRVICLNEEAHKVNGTQLQAFQAIKKGFNEVKDPLGRRSDEFYHSWAPLIENRNIKTAYEKRVEQYQPQK